MTRATVLQEVRQMRFEELYARRHRRELTMAEAATSTRYGSPRCIAPYSNWGSR